MNIHSMYPKKVSPLFIKKGKRKGYTRIVFLAKPTLAKLVDLAYSLNSYEKGGSVVGSRFPYSKEMKIIEYLDFIPCKNVYTGIFSLQNPKYGYQAEESCKQRIRRQYEVAGKLHTHSRPTPPGRGDYEVAGDRIRFIVTGGFHSEKEQFIAYNLGKPFMVVLGGKYAIYSTLFKTWDKQWGGHHLPEELQERAPDKIQKVMKHGVIPLQSAKTLFRQEEPHLYEKAKLATTPIPRIEHLSL